MSDPCVIDHREELTLAGFVRLVEDPPQFVLSSETREVMSRATALVDRIISSGEQVYGITTGFGPLVVHQAGDSPRAHQEQLIYHLATGTGDPLPGRAVRAAMLHRVLTLSRGYSGASIELVEQIAAFLSAGVEPEVPAYGSVGASGDLTPLAHVALAMMGEGPFLQGPGEKVLEILGLTRYRFGRRDALALVNGTSVSTGLTILAWWDAATLIAPALASMALMVDVLGLPRQAYTPKLQEVRGHPGQIAVARCLLQILGDDPAPGKSDLLQSAYSFRCIPQILGPAVEALEYAGSILTRELNGVTDNPVFDLASETVIHGGNFQGVAPAFACDSIALAIAVVANLLERQIARITDVNLNGGLPPFLTGMPPGGHSGLMGLQVSATALAGEINAAARSRYVLETRSTNGANQDVVSMSTLAGWRLYQVVPRLRELVAMHLITATQALDIAAPGGGAGGIYRWVRRQVPPLRQDRPLSAEIRSLADRLKGEPPTEGVPRLEELGLTG